MIEDQFNWEGWVNQVAEDYKIELIDKPIKGKYDAIVLAVAHDEFKLLTESQIRSYGKDDNIKNYSIIIN